MSNQRKTTIVGVVALAAVGGALLLGPVASKSFDSKDHASMNMTTHESDAGSSVQKDSGDYKKYAALKGEDYDKAFISNMITHHEGAVDMAKLALTNANRQEIKDMSNDIIASQSKEISDMKSWQQKWGYDTSSNDNMDHSSMSHGSMSVDMGAMTEKLKGKSGSEFDKAFLQQMIMHHQGAINMAAPGEQNAKHQEVKELTRAVIAAQTEEIKQMKAWQKEWSL